ncbi:galactokinase family protein [Paenibacillus sp. FSL R7-0337]
MHHKWYGCNGHHGWNAPARQQLAGNHIEYCEDG